MYGGFQQIGRTGLLRLPAAVNQAITAIQPKGDTLISEYLLGTLNYRVGYWRGVASSSRKDPNISSQDIRNFPIAYTSTTEQRAIAGALSDVDALLGALDQFIAKKRDLKQAAMQQLLTGQTRLPGFHGEWEVKRLGEITTLYQPVTISARQFIEAGYPVYGANGVVGFYHDFNHDCWQITVTCRGSTCGTVNRTVEKCWITGNAMVVNCGQNKDLNKDFLYYVLLSQDLSICITGTGQPQIVRGPLANLELSIPHDTAEQTAIAEVLTAMDAELAALEQRRDKTRALKQGMMQELLTGRTRLV
jgi:type I restriction enzyme S subunit